MRLNACSVPYLFCPSSGIVTAAAAVHRLPQEAVNIRVGAAAERQWAFDCTVCFCVMDLLLDLRATHTTPHPLSCCTCQAEANTADESPSPRFLSVDIGEQGGGGGHFL